MIVAEREKRCENDRESRIRGYLKETLHTGHLCHLYDLVVCRFALARMFSRTPSRTTGILYLKGETGCLWYCSEIGLWGKDVLKPMETISHKNDHIQWEEYQRAWKEKRAKDDISNKNSI